MGESAYLSTISLEKSVFLQGESGKILKVPRENEKKMQKSEKKFDSPIDKLKKYVQ